MFFIKRKKAAVTEIIIPEHIGIIMDGNGRWATSKGLPRSAGHKAGAATFKTIAKYANKIGVKCLTVYAFSSENWKRPKEEVDYLMDLLMDYLINAEKTLAGENVRIRAIGSRNELSEEMCRQIERTENLTKDRDGIVICFSEKNRTPLLICQIFPDTSVLLWTATEGGQKNADSHAVWGIRQVLKLLKRLLQKRTIWGLSI